MRLNLTIVLLGVLLILGACTKAPSNGRGDLGKNLKLTPGDAAALDTQATSAAVSSTPEGTAAAGLQTQTGESTETLANSMLAATTTAASSGISSVTVNTSVVPAPSCILTVLESTATQLKIELRTLNVAVAFLDGELVTLANGAYTRSSVPQPGKSGTIGATVFSASGELRQCEVAYHTPYPIGLVRVAQGFCAMKNGAVKCWGNAGPGAPGVYLSARGTTSATVVSGLESDVTGLYGGPSFACANKSGALYCFGANERGQLGDGTQNSRVAAAIVPGLSSGVSTAALGQEHGCAIQNGEVKCWGLKGTMTGNPLPPPYYQVYPQIVGPTLVAGINGHATSLGLTRTASCAVVDGAEKCWGMNDQGALASGPYIAGSYISYSSSAVAAYGLSSGVSLTTSGQHHCAVQNGAAKCWGSGPSSGDNSYGAIPVSISGLESGVTDIATGAYANCAVKEGEVYCWTRLSNSLPYLNLPVPEKAYRQTGFPAPVEQVAVGGYSAACALSGQNVFCWGANFYGALGNGTFIPNPTPAIVLGF